MGSYNFKFTVEQERRARERAAAVAEARREFEKAGVCVIERPDGYPWSSQEKPVQSFIDPQAEPVEGQPVRFTPLSHGAVCPHQAVIVDSYNGEPIHVCTDPVAAGHQPFRQSPVTAADPEEDPEAEAAWAAERQRQDQREEALIVAGRVRRRFAEGLVKPSSAKAAEPLLRLVVRDSLIEVLDESDRFIAVASSANSVRASDSARVIWAAWIFSWTASGSVVSATRLLILAVGTPIALPILAAVNSPRSRTCW